MMKCTEARKFLDTYVDGELEPATLVEVETHIEECEICASLVALERRLRREVRALSSIRAPADLRSRIVALPRRMRRRRIAAFAALPAAAAAALLVAFVLPARQDDEAQLASVLEDVVQRHARDLPMEVRGPDPGLAASWFRGKVDFPVVAPVLKIKNASFEGARLSNIRSDPAAHMTYAVDGHRVTLLVFNPHDVSLNGGRHVRVAGREAVCGHRNGYNVVAIRRGDLAYVLSSDLPEARLLALAAEIVP